MSNARISADSVSFNFQLGVPSVFQKLKFRRESRSFKTFRALDGLNFEIEPGDRVGIIGRNGAGKSTLLRLLSGVLHPTTGNLQIEGVTFPILDLSADVIPQATCMQNVKLRGLQFGLSGESLGEYIQLVCDDADVDDFLYSPVSSLSTGMRTRLLVSMIADLKPQILIIDEWIGTTDRSFTEKGRSKLSGIIESSEIFILASHDRALVKNHCEKVLLLDKGALLFFGDTDEGFSMFDQLVTS